MLMYLERRSERRQSNSDLVRKAQAGSHAAFERLVQDHCPAIFAFLNQLTHDRQLAADLAQDCFVSSYRYIGQLHDADAFTAWLYRIARNQWKMHLRNTAAQRDCEQLLCDLQDGQTEPNGFVYRHRMVDVFPERELIREVLSALSLEAREVLMLRHVWGFNDAEIGRILGISRAAAQKRAYRAERAFRDRYEQVMRESHEESVSEVQLQH